MNRSIHYDIMRNCANIHMQAPQVFNRDDQLYFGLARKKMSHMRCFTHRIAEQRMRICAHSPEPCCWHAQNLDVDED